MASTIRAWMTQVSGGGQALCRTSHQTPAARFDGAEEAAAQARRHQGEVEGEQTEAEFD